MQRVFNAWNDFLPEERTKMDLLLAPVEQHRWGTDHQCSCHRNSPLVNNVNQGCVSVEGSRWNGFVPSSAGVWPARGGICRWRVGSSGATSPASALEGEIPCATRDTAATSKSYCWLFQWTVCPKFSLESKEKLLFGCAGFSNSVTTQWRETSIQQDWPTFLPPRHCPCLLPALQRALAAPAQLWEAALGVDRRAFGRGGACTAWLKLQAGSQPDPCPGPGLWSVFHLLASVIPITKNSLKTWGHRSLLGCHRIKQVANSHLIYLVWEHDLDSSTHGYMERSISISPYCIMSLKLLAVHWFS